MHIGDKKSVQSLFANLYLMLMKKKIKNKIMFQDSSHAFRCFCSMTSSFHIFSSSSFTNHPVVECHIILFIERIIK